MEAKTLDAHTMDGYLERAACPAETRALVARLVASGHGCECLPVLARHRAVLLDDLHAADQRLACLDQVIASIGGATRR